MSRLAKLILIGPPLILLEAYGHFLRDLGDSVEDLVEEIVEETSLKVKASNE